MGKSQKPLRIALTDPDLLDRPEFQALAAKGHTVTVLEGEWDVVMGRRAWYMDVLHLKYLEQAVVAARKRAYPKKGPNETDENES